MNIDYVRKFINEDRKHLDWKNDIKILGNKFIRIENPQLLAAFIGYLKFQNKSIGKIYFRGENENHPGITPSLYRGNEITNEIIKNRTLAYNELLESIPPLFNSDRFKGEDINALLQHYGIKTNWIDLVDNLYVALWFALNKNSSESGFIKVLCVKNESGELKVSDLRENHSSLSLRPHCQHGISATRNVKIWNVDNINFCDYLVATIEIPNNCLFELKGEIFSDNYMFPRKDWDNTLKLFLSTKMRQKVNEIAAKYNLQNDELGKIK